MKQKIIRGKNPGDIDGKKYKKRYKCSVASLVLNVPSIKNKQFQQLGQFEHFQLF